MELGLGWLRAVAQGYSYICTKIELVSNVQRNSMSLGITWSGCLDGCARKVTVTFK